MKLGQRILSIFVSLSLLSVPFTTSAQGFLGETSDSAPTAVLEATNSQNSLRQLTLATANFSLGFIGLVAYLETGYGVITMDSKRIINGTMSITHVLISYAVINTMLTSGLGSTGY